MFATFLHFIRKRTPLAVWTCRLSLSKRSNRTMTLVRGDRLKTQVGVVTYFWREGGRLWGDVARFQRTKPSAARRSTGAPHPSAR